MPNSFAGKCLDNARKDGKMTRAEIANTLAALPPHSRKRAGYEHALRRLTTSELSEAIALDRMEAEMRVEFDRMWETGELEEV
jgi:outer membrane protein TolC